MDTREIVRRNIAYYIKKSQYTQAEIARMLDVSKPTVTNWVKGVNSPNIDLLGTLCEVLGIKFGDLFEENPEASAVLTPDEQELLTDYRAFNPEGQEKVREYIADLKGNPKYKKRPEPVVDKQA